MKDIKDNKEWEIRGSCNIEPKLIRGNWSGLDLMYDPLGNGCRREAASRLIFRLFNRGWACRSRINASFSSIFMSRGRSVGPIGPAPTRRLRLRRRGQLHQSLTKSRRLAAPIIKISIMLARSFFSARNERSVCFAGSPCLFSGCLYICACTYVSVVCHCHSFQLPSCKRGSRFTRVDDLAREDD